MTAIEEDVHARPTTSPWSISVLVPVLNEAETIDQTIACLLEQDYDGPMDFYVIDGGSNDDTVEKLQRVAKRDHRLHVLDNPARVPPAALNVGLVASKSDVIARMDAHNVYPPNYLSAGVERLAKGDVASVSGPMLAEAKDKWARRIAIALGSKLGTGEAAYRRVADVEFDVDSGFTGMWLRSTLVHHGGWDDETYPNEDAELAARIRAEGARIVCIPEMASSYQPRSSLRALAKQYWLYGQFRARTALHRPNSLRRSHVLAPGLAAAAVVAPLPIPLLSTSARVGLASYSMVSAAVSARYLAKRRSDAVALPVVFATMHLAWGFGFIRGMARFGVPTKALARIVKETTQPVTDQVAKRGNNP